MKQITPRRSITALPGLVLHGWMTWIGLPVTPVRTAELSVLRHSLLLSFGVLCLLVASANATLSVNSSGDEPDVNPGNGVCETAPGNGICTLRAAIMELNATNAEFHIVIESPGPGPRTIALNSDLPPITQGVFIERSGAAPVEINGQGFAGLELQANFNTIGGSSAGGLVINRCQNGIVLRNGRSSVISYNLIGTDVTGSNALPNTIHGIAIIDSSFCSIGGVGAANVISGNGGNGIDISGASSNNTVSANFIGVDISGLNALPNAGQGVHVLNAPGTTIGGNFATNGAIIISANTKNGVLIEGTGATGTVLSYARIGTDVTGMTALGNGGDGVLISGAPGNSLGAGTIISGNTSNGVEITGTTATDIFIGGTLIGADIDTNSLANGGDGVLIGGGASNNKLSSGNVIAFNVGNGVTVTSGTNNQVEAQSFGSSIFSNDGLGIDLGGDGVTPNDVNDADDGPNHLQNFPVVTSVTVGPTGTVFIGTLNSTPNKDFYVQHYLNDACDASGRGQGQTYLPFALVHVFADANGNASYSVTVTNLLPVGLFIAATAVDLSLGSVVGNTSEFSPCVQVMAADTGADLSITAMADPDPVEVASNLTYTITVSNDGPESATGVTVTNSLSPDVTFVTASTGCGASNGIVICNFGSLAIGASTNLTITVQPTTTGTLTNDVSVSATQPDSNSANNTAQTLTGVGGPRLEFDADTYTGKEGAGPATVTVVRLGDTSHAVGVHFVASDFSSGAEAGKDYQAVSTDLSFAPGDTSKTVMIPITDDDEAEFSEQVHLTLTNPTVGAQLGAVNEAVLVIKDNEPPQLSFRSEDQPFVPSLQGVIENAGTFTSPVFRRGDVDLAVSVDFKTKNGAAKEGLDFTVTIGTLQFASGVDTQELPCELIDNHVADGDRYFQLQLLNPQPAGAKLNISRRFILILDDEAPSDQKSATATDADGDGATASLKGNGSVQITPATLSGSLPAQSVSIAAASGTAFDIILSGTDAASAFSLKITKGASGDGLVNINSIVCGDGLKSITLKGADLTGDGIFLGGPLGSLTIHDIQNGASVLAGGTSNNLTTKFTAHVIGDDSTIALGGPIGSFTAASIGHSQIVAPAIGKLSVKGDKKLGIAGDFGADLDLSGEGVLPGAPVLAALTVGNTISNTVISALGNIGKVSAARIVDSALFAGFTPVDSTNALAGGVFIPGLQISSVATKAAEDSFVNSVLAAAQIGKIKLTTVQTNNDGMGLGVIAGESIDSVSVTAPSFNFDPDGSTNQNVGDFHVIKP